MKPKVVVTESIHQVGWDILAKETEAVAWAGQAQEPLDKVLEGAQAVLVRIARLSPEIIRGATHLRIIAKHGVGYDNIDVAEATKRGIMVTNTPGVLTETVADLTMALMLAIARRVVEADKYIRLDLLHQVYLQHNFQSSKL
jgi:glyoxylate reductase